MNWIFDHLQIVIVLVIVAVSLGRKVLETIAANKSAGTTTLEDILRPDAHPAEPESWPSSQSPQSMRKAATPPPMRKVTLGPPPLAVSPGAMDTELARQREMQERLRKIRDAKTKISPAPAAPTVIKRAASSNGLKSRLRSGKELRRAIVIREILSPPVGLR
jgi:hypothetical protein